MRRCGWDPAAEVNLDAGVPDGLFSRAGGWLAGSWQPQTLGHVGMGSGCHLAMWLYLSHRSVTLRESLPIQVPWSWIFGSGYPVAQARERPFLRLEDSASSFPSLRSERGRDGDPLLWPGHTHLQITWIRQELCRASQRVSAGLVFCETWVWVSYLSCLLAMQLEVNSLTSLSLRSLTPNGQLNEVVVWLTVGAE